jgi:competence protein ComEA
MLRYNCRRFARISLALWAGLTVMPIASAKKKPPAAPVNLNTADSEQLQLVPGIGPATAEKILQMRKAYGSFKSVDDLLAIRGIGPKRLEKMRKYLTVGKPAALHPEPSKSPTPKPVPPATTPCAEALTVDNVEMQKLLQSGPAHLSRRLAPDPSGHRGLL